jgi:LmbE family N-acetylglucosaminyl deacetylase
MNIDIRNAVVVAAHPDDEIIFFNSVLTDCKSVIVCFGPSLTGRESWDVGRSLMMEKYPIDKVQFLKVRQSDAYDAANWRHPQETDFGLRLRRPSESYEKNADELTRQLRQRLKTETLVITHNPWGEYGNEEHIQIYRVVRKLQQELNFRLLVDNYFSDRSAKFMLRNLELLSPDLVMRQSDVQLASKIKELYCASESWTWMPDYEWPHVEIFYPITDTVSGTSCASTASLPMNYVTHTFQRGPIRRIAGLLPDSAKRRITASLRILRS